MVNITTPNTNSVNANTMGNSQRARSWAIGEGLIDGEDYSAKHYAQLAKEIEENISQDTNNAYIWAEGTDEEVEALGGEHSSKGWVNYVLTNPPEAYVQQTDTGCTLTVTDINGTTTADLLNGAKGDKGDKGDKGAKGNTGATGNGVLNTQYISTSGLVDTYHINYTNGNYDSFTVTNGANGTGSVADVWVNGTSVLDGNTAKIDLTNYVTTDTAQDISGRKTFLGEKVIYFKQTTTSDKLGFTLYNPSNTELGALEWRPNTIGSNSLLALNCPQATGGYVGFRYWGSPVVNIVAPKVATAGNYYIPTHITDGTNTVTASNTGTVNISTLLPDVSNFVTNSSLATTLADYQPLLVSGTNIKTINNTSLLGSGNISLVGDDTTISKNSDDELQTIGVIDDNSKNAYNFTVVGSPTITADGIASGFSSKGYIKLNNSIQIGASSNFKIEFQFTVGNTWVENWIFAAATANNFCVWIGTGGLNAYINNKNIINLAKSTFAQNGSYKGYFKREGGIYTLYCENLKTHTSKTGTATATGDDSFSGELWIGKSGNNRDWSTDLKQFKITVDGVEVYKAWQPQALKYWTGTKAEYNAIVQKVNDTIYNLTDTGQIYKGTELIADKTKLYTTVGQNTDGTMTQKAITDELYYAAGETFAVSNYYCQVAACVTSSKTTLQFNIPLPKQIPSGVTPRITSLDMTGRSGSSGVIISNYKLSDADSVSIYYINGNTIWVAVTSSKKYQSITNNTGLILALKDVTIEFS